VEYFRNVKSVLTLHDFERGYFALLAFHPLHYSVIRISIITFVGFLLFSFCHIVEAGSCGITLNCVRKYSGYDLGADVGYPNDDYRCCCQSEANSKWLIPDVSLFSGLHSHNGCGVTD
jgi:hypothetical protein